jgi:hypothetical protein
VNMAVARLTQPTAVKALLMIGVPAVTWFIVASAIHAAIVGGASS